MRKPLELCFYLTLTALLLLPLGGCWNRREPNDLALIMGMGIDVIEATGEIKVIVTVAAPVPSGEEAGGTSGQGSSEEVVFSASGPTVFAALRNLCAKMSRELHLTHLSHLFFSEAAARAGIAPLLEVLDRERQTRLSVDALVVDGDLYKLLEAKYPLDSGSREFFRRLLLTAHRESSETKMVPLYQVLNDFYQPGLEVVLPRIQVVEQSPGQLTGECPAVAGGLAVFNRDRLVGWADRKETRGLFWVTGDIEHATCILPSPAGGGEAHGRRDLVAVEVFWGRSRLEAHVGEAVRITVHIEAEGRIQETAVAQEWLDQRTEKIDALNRRLAQAIRNDVQAALNKLQKELHSDAFGFGNLIYRTQYDRWLALEQRWEAIYPEVEVEVLVTAQVRRSGLVRNPIIIR